MYENNYVNENIIITNVMTPVELQDQAQELYDDAKNNIIPKGFTERISNPAPPETFNTVAISSSISENVAFSMRLLNDMNISLFVVISSIV